MRKLAADSRNLSESPSSASSPPITVETRGFHDSETGLYIQLFAWQSGKVEIAFQDGNTVTRVAMSALAAEWVARQSAIVASHAKKNLARRVGSGGD